MNIIDEEEVIVYAQAATLWTSYISQLMAWAYGGYHDAKTLEEIESILLPLPNQIDFRKSCAFLHREETLHAPPSEHIAFLLRKHIEKKRISAKLNH